MTGSDGTERARDRISTVLESDLDLVLLLDGNCGGPLVRHLLSVGGLEPVGPVRTARSTRRNAGVRQTDIEVTWDGGALLIENKLESGFTVGQCESYREEVDRRRAVGQQVSAVLVCPGRRLAGLEGKAAGLFDVIVTTEQLLDVLGKDDDRLAEGLRLILRAASEARLGDDPTRSEWGDGYRAALNLAEPWGSEVAPGDGSLRSASATVAEFVSSRLDPEQVWKLGHHLTAGVVRMELDVTREEIAGLPVGVEHKPKARMQYLEVPVPPMTFDLPAGDQLAALVPAAKAIVELREWALRHLDGA